MNSKAPDILHIDLETYSDCDLINEGLPRYAAHPSTEILMVYFALNDNLVRGTDSQDPDHPAWKYLQHALVDPNIIKMAHNCSFEIAILASKACPIFLSLNLDQWVCTATMARGYAFPGSLANAVPAMDLPEELHKDIRGSVLINMFSIPQKPTKRQPLRRLTKETNPEEWKEFRQYCAQDVVAERAIHNRIKELTYEER